MPWGWANKMTTLGERKLLIENALTTCMPENLVWMVQANRLTWDDLSQVLEVDGGKLLWYRRPVLSMGRLRFVHGEQARGWLLPRIRQKGRWIDA